MSQESQEPKKTKGISGLAIPAGVLIGLGVDFALNSIPSGLFIGLGCGFLITMAIRLKTGEW